MQTGCGGVRALRPGRSVRKPAVAALSLALLAGAVRAAEAVTTTLPQQLGNVDLASQANVRIDGAFAYDHAGSSVANAGDVNADGRDDVVIGAPYASSDGRRSSGAVYVVFGQPTLSYIDLAAIGDRGFRIDGAAVNDWAGKSVSGAGDVNGDGHADIVIGAPYAQNNGRYASGAAYVVFGKSSTASVDLASLGDGGIRIDGANAYDHAGSVASAGDVNGDRRADVIVGASTASENGRVYSGSAYVVFGRNSAATIDLASLGDGGFRIDGAAKFDSAGWSVAGAGDVNGDGRADIVLGADGAANNERIRSGSAYVVFGNGSSTNVDLGALDGRGFEIDGASEFDDAGALVAGAGDLNGDGLADVLVGAPWADNNARDLSGSTYVVFGKSTVSPVDLASLGRGGIRIDGANTYDRAGSVAARAGDLNGDGAPDIVIGVPSASNAGRIGSGSAYVVSGLNPGADVDLRSARSSIVRIDGSQVYYEAGASVSGAGDFNGDARPDLIVGSPSASFRNYGGAAYIIYGFGAPEVAYDPIVATVGQPVAHRPRAIKRTGPTLFSVSPVLPPGLEIDRATGSISGIPSEGSQAEAYTITMSDLAGSVTAPLEITVVDKTAPALMLSGPSSQHVLRKHGVIVQAWCDESCSVTATGTIKVRKSVVALTRATADLDLDETATVRLTLSKKAAARLLRLLTPGIRARAFVTVRGVDRFGNSATARRAIVVRR